MNKMNDYNIPSVRLNAGLYALSKLAGAGLTFLLVSLLLLLGLPAEDGIPKGWPVSVPYAIYAYGLPASLAADALLRLLRTKSPIPALLVYAAAGAGAGLWLNAEQGGNLLPSLIAGVLVLLLFYFGQLAGDRFPLLLPAFALFIPLLCLLLL